MCLLNFHCRVPDGFFDVDNNDSTIVTSESDRHADSAATPNPNPPLSDSNLPAGNQCPLIIIAFSL